jgi:hypothetical protein
MKTTRNKHKSEHDSDGSSDATVFERFAKASVRVTGHPAALGMALGDDYGVGFDRPAIWFQ